MSNPVIALSAEGDVRPVAFEDEKYQGFVEDGPDVIDFDGDDDPASPLNWSNWYKWTVVFLASVLGLVVNMSISMAAPATLDILHDFDSSNKLMATLLVSIWELGEVFGPFLIAPLSEIYGRLPVYHVANLLFITFSVTAALSNSISMLIGLRFLMGLAVASSVLNPVMVGDMFREEERGRAMGLMGITPYIAPFLGPLLGGLITDARGWRWIFWVNAMVAGTFQLLFMMVCRETYPVIILKRKAQRLREATGNTRLHSRYDTTATRQSVLIVSMCRPWKLLGTSLTIWGVGICGVFSMTMMYVIVTSLPSIYVDTYHFSTGSLGLTYFGTGVGMVLGVTLSGYLTDRFVSQPPQYIRGRAECRLPPMLFGSLITPAGMLGFGWAVQQQTHYMVPIVLSGLVGMGFCAVVISAWGYLVDAFGVYAASANAAAMVLRNAGSAALPLAAPPLVRQVGYGWGFFILALISLTIAAPIPIWLMRRGERLRKREQTR